MFYMSISQNIYLCIYPDDQVKFFLSVQTLRVLKGQKN